MLTEIKAEFIGKDGSMGFKKGKIYELWHFVKGNKIYISKRNINAVAIPYDTIIALKKNWKIL